MTDSSEITLNYLQNMDPYKFEQLVADVWEERGFRTRVTDSSNDRGIDIKAKRKQPNPKRILIQSKRYGSKTKVDSGEIQKYSGLYQRDEPVDDVIVVTSNEFTDEAIEVAETRGVKTVSGEELLSQVRSLGFKIVAPNATKNKSGGHTASGPWKIRCPFCNAKIHNATESLIQHWAFSDSCSFDIGSPKEIDILNEEWDTVVKKVREARQNRTIRDTSQPITCPFCESGLPRSTSKCMNHFLNICRIDSTDDIPPERPTNLPPEIWWELKEALKKSDTSEKSKSKSDTSEKSKSKSDTNTELPQVPLSEADIQTINQHPATEFCHPVYTLADKPNYIVVIALAKNQHTYLFYFNPKTQQWAQLADTEIPTAMVGEIVFDEQDIGDKLDQHYNSDMLDPAEYQKSPVQEAVNNFPSEPLTDLQLRARQTQNPMIVELMPLVNDADSEETIAVMFFFDDPIKEQRITVAAGYIPESGDWHVLKTVDSADPDLIQSLEQLESEYSVWVDAHYTNDEIDPIEDPEAALIS